MNKNLRNIYLLFGSLIILVIVGFFILIQKVNVLEKSLIATKSETISNGTSTLVAYDEEKSQDTNNENMDLKKEEIVPLPEGNVITSNIIFTAEAVNTYDNSLIKLPVLINKITKDPNGILNVYVKVFTDQISNVSSLEISDLVQIFSEKSGNIKANKITGDFKKMQPQSSTDGVLSFIINPSLDKLIIQVGGGDDIEFYEIDFINRTYQKTTVG